MPLITFEAISFGTIRNNTALKRYKSPKQQNRRFGTIRNNTALKLLVLHSVHIFCFGTIRNNTALKHALVLLI